MRRVTEDVVYYLRRQTETLSDAEYLEVVEELCDVLEADLEKLLRRLL